MYNEKRPDRPKTHRVGTHRTEGGFTEQRFRIAQVVAVPRAPTGRVRATVRRRGGY